MSYVISDEVVLELKKYFSQTPEVKMLVDLQNIKKQKDADLTGLVQEVKRAEEKK